VASPKCNRNFKERCRLEKQKSVDLKLMSMEEIQAEEVEWLLYPFIPYGKVTIV